MKMSELPLGDKVLLTAAQVTQWRDEYSSLSDQRDAISAKLAKLEEKLAAVALITGTSVPAILGVADEDEETSRESLTAAVKRVIRTAGKPMSRHDIRVALLADPEWGDRLRRSPNSFYNAMGRLAGREEIKQEGERFRLEAE
jgi:hypothetical protein